MQTFLTILHEVMGVGLAAHAVYAAIGDPNRWRDWGLRLLIGLVFCLTLPVKDRLCRASSDRAARRAAAQRGLEARIDDIVDKAAHLIMAPSSPDVAKYLLNFHRPTLKRCWLLVTTANPPEWISMEGLAEQLKERAEQWPSAPLVEIVTLEHPFSADEARRKVAGLLAALRDEDRKHAVVDLTGGTALISVGMAAAAVEAGATLSYTPTQYHLEEESWRASSPHEPLVVKVSGSTDLPRPATS